MTRQQGIDIRARLRTDVWWVLGLSLVLYAVSELRGDKGRLGWDAHAYYVAWHGPMYSQQPGQRDAYNYSPAFAQVLWPFAHLPWPVFCALLVGAAAVGVAWLVRPLQWKVAIPVWLCCTPEILSGNIYWLLAIVVVLGFRYPGLWAISALTKIIPTLGPIWFLLRREWRPLLWSAATTLAVAGISYLIAPHLWHDWLQFLAANNNQQGRGIVPPVIYRIPVGLALLAWGARTNRTWTLPAAMCIVTPVFGIASLTMLAAIPRLQTHPTTDPAPTPA